jgi:glycolate dehydrogenase iron-sulfur subunit
MQVRLADFLQGTPEGEEAAAILGRCVHCGFCTATCPTYQLLGDELDGPRGRIYLIKQVAEGTEPTAKTQLHLDRCLGCRGCETTCPSGVEYGRLLDIGRRLVAERVPRPAGARLSRAALREGLTGSLFPAAMRAGQALRPLLPAALREQVPPRRAAGAWPRRSHVRKALLLAGCVQPAMMPNINAATARVLDRLGIETIVPEAAGCCGAIRQHLEDPDGGMVDARRNIDAWWPQVAAGAEAIVMNASGCGSMVREYGHLLRHDADYADKAARISAMTRDLAEWVPGLLAASGMAVARGPGERVAFHPPCSLQHGQRIRGAVEALLALLGAEVVPFADAHLCCGSAGTYSLLQPALSRQLRDRKLDALNAARPDVILSANIGCIAHLGPAATVPVRHWIEWLDGRLAAS